MIKFMVDSGSDYDVNEAKEKGIAFVPLSITFDNDTYKDGIGTTAEDKSRLLKCF